MSDVDGRPEFGQSLFYDLNRAIDAGAETTRRSEQNFERWLWHGHFDLFKAEYGRTQFFILIHWV
jgi:hypothetical protein